MLHLCCGLNVSLLVRGDGGEGRVSIILQSLFPLPLNSSVTHTSAKLTQIKSLGATSLAQSDVLSSLQEHVLSFCEVTCLEHVSPLLFAGTSSGSVIMWNLETEKVVLRSV